MERVLDLNFQSKGGGVVYDFDLPLSLPSAYFHVKYFKILIFIQTSVKLNVLFVMHIVNRLGSYEI